MMKKKKIGKVFHMRMKMMNDFPYSDLLPLGEDQSKYRLISTEGVTTFTANGKEFLENSNEEAYCYDSGT